jgi:hypothetical protein
MITSQEFKKKLRRATTETVRAMHLFLKSDETVNYDQIAKILDNKEVELGRAVGGVLSTLSRTLIEEEPFIIPLGPDRSDPQNKRRMIWKLNPNAVSPELKPQLKQVAAEVLQERK